MASKLIADDKKEELVALLKEELIKGKGKILERGMHQRLSEEYNVPLWYLYNLIAPIKKELGLELKKGSNSASSSMAESADKENRFYRTVQDDYVIKLERALAKATLRIQELEGR
jgi:hypothetical protein